MGRRTTYFYTSLCLFRCGVSCFYALFSPSHAHVRTDSPLQSGLNGESTTIRNYNTQLDDDTRTRVTSSMTTLYVYIFSLFLFRFVALDWPIDVGTQDLHLWILPTRTRSGF